MSEIARAYERGEIRGWVGAEKAAQHRKMVGHLMSRFRIVGQTMKTSGRKAMLYQVARKLLGGDIPTQSQAIGDCTSFGAEHAVELLDCAELVANGGTKSDFHLIFPSYFYGASRVLIGKGQIPANEDGSSGAWTAAAALTYGALRADFAGVPAYSAQVAKQWGATGPPSQFIPEGQKHLIGSAAKITSWDDLMAALVNYYPVTIASDQGFEMEPRSDGFHHPGTEPWPHQMCVMGGDETYSQPYAIIMNSWGDCLGHLKDFQTGEDLPTGVLRVQRLVIEHMIQTGELYAFSKFADFQEQSTTIDSKLFKIIGK